MFQDGVGHGAHCLQQFAQIGTRPPRRTADQAAIHQAKRLGLRHRTCVPPLAETTPIVIIVSGAARGTKMRPDAEHRPQGALRQPDGSVVWRVWAPLSAQVSLVTLSSGERQETAMTPDGRRLFHPSASRGPTKDCGIASSWPTAASIPIRRRAGSPRASTPRRPCSFPNRTLVGRGLARRGPRRPGDLRIARGRLHAGGDAGCDCFPLARTALAGRDGDRTDAGGPVCRRPQLGLRRRLSLRRAKQLRRAPGAAAVGRRRPSASGWP